MWCIYETTNLINGKTYIGQHEYKKLYDGYLGSGKILKQAIKKYGKENFFIRYLFTELPNRHCANMAEKHCISLMRKHGKAEYNICDGGEGHSGKRPDMIGNQYAKGVNIGNKYSKGKNLGNQFAKGNHLSEQTRKQMGISRQGNVNNGCAYIQCIETEMVFRTREWIKEGFANAYSVAKGRQKTCKGFHFKYVSTQS